MKVGLLVLRNNGLQYLQKVIDRISVIDSLTLKAVLQIKWKEEEADKNIRSIYEHIKEGNTINKIIELQGTSMIAIILLDSKPDPLNQYCLHCGRYAGEKRIDNMNINRIKNDIRVQYGNIIHSADTEELAIVEIDKFGGGEIIKFLYSMDNKVLVNAVYSCDQILEQLNTMENGTKVWTPPNK